MSSGALFCSLSSIRIAEMVRTAEHAVCYAGPGIQPQVAKAMVEAAQRLGPEMLTVSVDFDDRVMRMGYGDVGAVKLLLDSGIAVQSSSGLRTALVIVDNEGYIFTPTALYLEAEPVDDDKRCLPNRLRIGGRRLIDMDITARRHQRGAQLRAAPAHLVGRAAAAADRAAHAPGGGPALGGHGPGCALIVTAPRPSTAEPA